MACILLKALAEKGGFSGQSRLGTQVGFPTDMYLRTTPDWIPGGWKFLVSPHIVM